MASKIFDKFKTAILDGRPATENEMTGTQFLMHLRSIIKSELQYTNHGPSWYIERNPNGSIELSAAAAEDLLRLMESEWS